MSIPNTNTFTLQNVVTEINPTTDDLVDCFADANASGFDPAYKGSKNQLLNFRNYDHNASSLTSIYRTNKSPKAGAFSCGYTTNLQMWHNGSSAYLVNGDVVYSNAAGTTFGAQGYYGFNPLNGYAAIVKCHLNSVGVVSGVTTCLLF